MRRRARIPVALALVLALVPGSPGSGSPAVRAAPTADPARYGTLEVEPYGLPRYAGKVCEGSTLRLVFFVTRLSPLIEGRPPVVEAMVEVRDDQGLTRAKVTDKNGRVGID